MSIKFVEYDSETVVSALVGQFENALKEKLQPSDERRIFLNQLAQVVVQINASINETGNQVLLRYARGETLDAIGEMFGVTRLPAGRAKCTLRFTLSQPQSVDITIPIGTRATPDGKAYFATVKELKITAGNTIGEVDAEALTEGEMEYAENEIKYIVDNVQFLASVTNINPTSGGSDAESDDSLRERIRLVPESFSTAGCTDGYKYWAKSASADVGDVVVYSPVNDMSLSDEARAQGAGKVYIYFLKKDGGIPTEDDTLLVTVRDTVSSNDVRPLTDQVFVLPPTKVNYSINLKYYISEENDDSVSKIQERVSKAINEYVKWQGEKIGRDINPDKLRNLILNAGASRVDITSPAAYQTIKATEIAVLNGDIVASYEGISE